MSSSLNHLYQVVGVSKQAVAQYADRQARLHEEVATLEVMVQEIRKVHGGCGLEKLYYRLKPESMGRDRFIQLFQNLGYGIKKRPSRPKTTIRGDFYYPNLIEGICVLAPLKVWQTDLTYIQVGQRYFYLIFIIDIYSKQIVGYGAFDHMRAEANLAVLDSALKQARGHSLKGLIHHSDRGSQYIAKSYRQRLLEQKIFISMGGSGTENAYAERVNGIIKNEYLAYKQLTDFNKLKRELRKAVYDYNHHRPHNHLHRLSPMQFLRQFEQKKLPAIPIVLIPAKMGPSFKNRKRFLVQQNPNNNNLYCPTQNNQTFYHQTVNPI